MFDSHFVKRALSQMLMTLTFGLTCLAVSALILAGASPADGRPGRAGGQEIELPKNDLRLASPADRRPAGDLASAD